MIKWVSMMLPFKLAKAPKFDVLRAIGAAVGEARWVIVPERLSRIGFLSDWKMEISKRVEQLVSLALTQIGIPPESWRVGCSIFSAIVVSGLAWARHR